MNPFIDVDGIKRRSTKLTFWQRDLLQLLNAIAAICSRGDAPYFDHRANFMGVAAIMQTVQHRFGERRFLTFFS